MQTVGQDAMHSAVRARLCPDLCQRWRRRRHIENRNVGGLWQGARIIVNRAQERLLCSIEPSLLGCKRGQFGILVKFRAAYQRSCARMLLRELVLNRRDRLLYSGVAGLQFQSGPIKTKRRHQIASMLAESAKIVERVNIIRVRYKYFPEDGISIERVSLLEFSQRPTEGALGSCSPPSVPRAAEPTEHAAGQPQELR